jgi:hypothetical protein
MGGQRVVDNTRERVPPNTQSIRLGVGMADAAAQVGKVNKLHICSRLHMRQLH